MLSMEQSLFEAGLLTQAPPLLMRDPPPVFAVCPHCRRQLNKHGNCPAHGAVVPMNSAVVNRLPSAGACAYCGENPSQHSIFCQRPMKGADKRTTEYDGSAA